MTRRRWHFHTDQIEAATELVRRFHYSRRMPSVVFAGTAHDTGGLFGDFGPAVAACAFQVPPTRWSEDVLELTRLVRRDEAAVSLSELVAWCSRRLRARGADLLVSFADATQGHHGGIYQACGWNYGGQRNRAMDGLVVNGVYVPGRTCNNRFGTRSPERLAALHPTWTVEPHWDDGKHLYWKTLNRSGDAKAARLELLRLPYPKPRRAGSIESDASVNPDGRRGRTSRPGALITRGDVA